MRHRLKRIASSVFDAEDVRKRTQWNTSTSSFAHGKVDKGISQSIVEGSQLPISTIERTIIDSVTYTKESAVGDAPSWTRATLSKSIDYSEFEQIATRAYSSVNSVAARLGFLLETASAKSNLREKMPWTNLFANLRGLASKTRAHLQLGREKTDGKIH